MDGLSPVYDWLQRFDGSTNGYPVPQIPDWNYGLDQWPEFYAPGEVGLYEQSQLPGLPSAVVDHGDSQLAPAADYSREDPSRQLITHETVEPDQLQITALHEHVDSRLQCFAGVDGHPNVNERVSDWLATSQPDTQQVRHAQHSKHTGNCVAEVEALRSEVAEYVTCFPSSELGSLMQAPEMSSRCKVHNGCNRTVSASPFANKTPLKKISRQAARFTEAQRQVEALMKWAAEVSMTFNDFQLKEQGMSPLQKHFGLVLGPRLDRKPSGPRGI